jgi:hypothetical protein
VVRDAEASGTAQGDAAPSDAGRVLAIHPGHSANCSSIGSVVDVLFVSGVVGTALLAALGVLLGARDDAAPGGSGAAGADPGGPASSGHDATGDDAVRRNATGPDASGRDASGRDATGHDAPRHDARGREAAGDGAQGAAPSSAASGSGG